MEIAEKVAELVSQRPEYREILERCLEAQEKSTWSEHDWEISDVHVWPGKLQVLLNEGIITYTYRSRSTKRYKFVDPEAVRRGLETVAEAERAETEPRELEIPPDLFAPLVGFEDIKETFLKSLRAEKPVHILLISPPATVAKSTFLMELERIPGARFVSFGGGTTRVGLRDVLAEAPRITLLDEIDKVANPLDLSALMNWMESGRVTINKHKEHREIRGKGYVFAAANTTRGLSPELLSRFMVFRIPPYNREQYIEVTKRVLTMREGTDPELAGYIARRMADEGSRDVRDCIQLARLAKTREEADKFLETMRRYG
jgi:hypothetical protein